MTKHLSLLQGHWDQQNYVAKFFMSSLQSTIDSGSSAGVLIAMVDAAFVEQAFLVRDELVKCIPSYPDGWKKAILQICLEYRDRDEKYHARLLDAAEGFPF